MCKSYCSSYDTFWFIQYVLLITSLAFFFLSNHPFVLFFLIFIWAGIYIVILTQQISQYKIIEVLVFYRLKWNNKIWDCDQPQLKINILWKYCNTCYHNIFTIVEISVSYSSNKKLLSSQYFHMNFTTNHML